MIARRSVLAGLLSTAAASAAKAQGFAGLGADATGFALPERGRPLVFPDDHGPHPAFRIEWWYMTANLSGPDGQSYGVQWTLFRSALAPEAGPGEGLGWQTPQIWMGHAALTTATQHHVAQKLARGGIGQAGVTTRPFEAWIDDWSLRNPMPAATLDTLEVSARGKDFSYTLNLRANGPLILQGDAGYSVKSPAGAASYYYSQPFYDVSGTLTLAEGSTQVTGQAWLDREWSSQPLAANQEGWDWLSLHFDDGAKLMAFGLRDTDGGHFTSATWIAPDGTATPYDTGALTLAPLETTQVAGRQIPIRWRLALPARGVLIETQALNPQSWMDTLFPYWEGPVTFDGSHTGKGYLEMTGYD